MPDKFDDPPQWLWVPLASAAALAVPGLVALVTHRLLLFASLGPTAVTIAQQPLQPSARTYNALVGHALGFATGAAVVVAFGLTHAASVFVVHELTVRRVGAAILAIAIAALLELALRAKHPPAASTTLLVALGSFHPTWNDTLLVLGGVVLVTAAGELLRRVRLRLSRLEHVL
ncbi:MAG TPA: HPP family protein [Steroidobacteraceae bacterium]|nr:HPP family protein [Steroidobacteraceae bacterium]